MIFTLIKTQFGTVVAKNGKGKLISRSCGTYEEIKGEVLKEASPKAVFLHEDPDGKLSEVAREDW